MRIFLFALAGLEYLTEALRLCVDYLPHGISGLVGLGLGPGQTSKVSSQLHAISPAA